MMRPGNPLGVIAATGYSTFVLSATPFLLPDLSERYHIGSALAASTSTAQLAGFVVATFGAGRFLHPRRRIFLIAVAISIFSNAGSALLPAFPILVGLRFISGVSLGLLAWFAWSTVFGDRDRMSGIAVIGPVMGVIAAPILSGLTDSQGSGGVFAMLAVGAILVAVPNRGTAAVADPPARSARHAPNRSATTLLIGLACLTFGGSAVFVNGALLGASGAGLSTRAVSLVYSANALAGIPSAHWSGPRRSPGFWFGLTGICAVVVSTTGSGVLFAMAMALWGFSFWMGVPAAYDLLARCSRFPSERAGDAQAIMAAGRVLGPVVGGALIDGPGPTALGIVAGTVMIGAGLAIAGVAMSTARDNGS